MKTINITCQNCNKSFEKPLNEYNRKVRNNIKVYCSLSCSAKDKPMFGGKPNRIPPIQGRKAIPFSYYLNICKQRNKEFNLDSEYLQKIWIEQKGLCYITKIPLILNTSTKYNNDYRYVASIDRIDSNKGYIKGNVQFISLCVNLMKNTLTQEQTKDFLKEISKNI